MTLIFFLAAVAVVLLAVSVVAGMPAGAKPAQPWRYFPAGLAASGDIALAVYGDEAERIAQMTAAHSGLDCYAVSDMQQLEALLATQDVKGILALARMSHPDEAGEAIKRFRQRYPNGIAIYGAWDYNIEHAAAHAIKYEADGIMMPDMSEPELLAYLAGIIMRADLGEARPATVEEYREQLNAFAPRSNFQPHQALAVH